MRLESCNSRPPATGGFRCIPEFLDKIKALEDTSNDLFLNTFALSVNYPDRQHSF